ncbi:MAG: sulfatase-like hydrolase/transferase [Verrucomicrobiaceae bacterium]|nr:sulfatase-like hydrolase/transferase [Verrucomicrobiaceae bacterium]
MKHLAPALLLFALCSPSFAEPKPNIVIIFIDDLGYADIGPFGATKQKAPNLDRMAREGMKLTSFYAAPVCSVSRAQMMTGCYGARVSVPGVYPPGSKNGLHPREFGVFAVSCGSPRDADRREGCPTRRHLGRNSFPLEAP